MNAFDDLDALAHSITGTIRTHCDELTVRVSRRVYQLLQAKALFDNGECSVEHVSVGELGISVGAALILPPTDSDEAEGYRDQAIALRHALSYSQDQLARANQLIRLKGLDDGELEEKLERLDRAAAHRKSLANLERRVAYAKWVGARAIKELNELKETKEKL